MSNAPKNISQDRESQQTQSAQTGMQSTMENEEPQLLICKKPNFEQKSTTHDQLTINEQRKTKRKPITDRTEYLTLRLAKNSPHRYRDTWKYLTIYLKYEREREVTPAKTNTTPSPCNMLRYRKRQRGKQQKTTPAMQDND